MKGPRLRVISGAAAVAASPLDADAFQATCVEGFVASWSARGFSPVTIENATGVLDRFLEMLGIPAWEASPDDVDRVVGELVTRGMAASTRRGYVQAFKDFHRFLVARKAAEIEATFGVVLDDPVDEFNAARHVGNDGSPATRPPPTPERMEEFFAFLRDRVATARKFASAGRDYALFRTLYHCGLRSDEAASLERADLHFDRGPFGKVHVRFGKGARGSGPRPRWVPMLDQVDLILRWFLDDVRPRMADSAALFCDEGGGVVHRGTIRNRLRYLLELEGAPVEERFSPHGLRHACATRNYERGVDLVAIGGPGSNTRCRSPRAQDVHARGDPIPTRDNAGRPRPVPPLADARYVLHRGHRGPLQFGRECVVGAHDEAGDTERLDPAFEGTFFLEKACAICDGSMLPLRGRSEGQTWSRSTVAVSRELDASIDVARGGHGLTTFQRRKFARRRGHL